MHIDDPAEIAKVFVYCSLFIIEFFFSTTSNLAEEEEEEEGEDSDEGPSHSATASEEMVARLSPLSMQVYITRFMFCSLSIHVCTYVFIMYLSL